MAEQSWDIPTTTSIVPASSLAVVIDEPGSVSLRELSLKAPAAEDVVVAVSFTGISTGTEKLLFTGRMPPFPGMGYPLVPGYEAVGEIVWAGPDSGRTPGERVFVPGASCYEDAHGLFGATASTLVVAGSRTVPLGAERGPEGVLLALAATAQHALSVCLQHGDHPSLIVGHGVVGRLLARLALANGAPAAPVVWENTPQRRAGAQGYGVLAPADDERRDHRAVIDASGDPAILDSIMPRLAKGGRVVLAGFYSEPVRFAFPPAFLREAVIAVAAEWQPEDLETVRAHVAHGRLSLDGLISHQLPASEAVRAFPLAFEDPTCLKLVLDWRNR